MEPMTEACLRQINDMLLKIHTQRDLTQLRLDFLRDIQGLIPHQRAFFDLCQPRQDRLFFFDPVSLDMDQSQLSAYYQQYQYSDYVAWSFASDEPMVYKDSDMISPALRERSAIYIHWMEPMGIYYSIGSTVMGRCHLFGSVTLFRSREEGDFSGLEVQILRILNQHLSAHFAFLWPDGPVPQGNSSGFDRMLMQRGISNREAEIAKLVTQGLTNQEIARQLYISENTVKKHINSLFRKLGIASRVQLLRLLYVRPAVIVPPREE